MSRFYRGATRPSMADDVCWTSSGNSRATTQTPTTHGDPARHDRELRADERRHDGRLHVADPRPAGHDQAVDRHHPAAQPVGRLELDEGRAEDGREDVGGAGQRRERHEGQRERDGHSPNAVIASPRRRRRARSPARSAARPRPSPRRARRGTPRRPAPRRAARDRPDRSRRHRARAPGRATSASRRSSR